MTATPPPPRAVGPVPYTAEDAAALQALAAAAVASSPKGTRLDDFTPEDFGREDGDDGPFLGAMFFWPWATYIAAAVNATPSLLATLDALQARLAAAEGVVAPRGCRPDGNRATVEVVMTSDLVPDDVVWGQDGWYCVLDGEESDSTQVRAALIIDDAGGQNESTLLYGEFFLRAASLPTPPAPSTDKENA